MYIVRQREVVDQLREKILSEDIPGGERLLEVPLSSELQVSRTPIREALITLSEEGLVEYRPNRGYVVRNFTAKEILDAYVVREGLESMACRIIAENGIDDDLKAALRECLNTGDELLSGDRLPAAAREPWGELNHRFHSLIMEAADNRALTDALRRVTNIPYSSSRVVHWFDETDVQGLYQLRFVHTQHHSIFQAICAGEGYRAEGAMRGHISFAAEHISAKFFGGSAASTTAVPLKVANGIAVA